MIYFKHIIFLCLWCFSNGLYEDQVGKFDWKQSYVGRVQYSHIDYVGKRVYVATENNVVAGINLLDGSLLWRKVLEAEADGEVHAFSAGSEVLTVSGSGPFVLRAWNLKTGLLVNEWPLPEPAHRNGQWTVDSQKVYQVVPSDGRFELMKYHIKTANPATSKPELLDLSSDQWLLDKGYMFVVSVSGEAGVVRLSDSKQYHTSKVSAGESSLSEVASTFPAALLTRGESSFALVFYDDQLLVQPLPHCTTLAVTASPQGPVILCATHSKYAYVVEEIGLTNNLRVAGKEIGSKLPKGTISSVDPHSCFLIRGNDDSIILVEKGKVLWTREEALANVVSAEMVDLPISDEEAAIEKEFADKEGGIIGMFWRRIHSQGLQAVNLVMSVLGLKQTSEDAILGLKKDQFGLHKLIVLVTKSSKVYGMKSERGEIVWQFYLGEDLAPFSVLGKDAVPFFVHRTSRHFSLPALATLIFKQKVNGLSALYVFNPINGQPLYGGLINLDFKVQQILQLPREDGDFVRGLLLLGENGAVRVFPESSRPVALSLHRQLYTFTVSSQEGILEGFSFSKAGNELKSVKVWNVRLNPPIVDVAMRNKAERVHSQGRVLADRSVLYKYINPHLIAVTTYNTDPIHKNIVTVFLIDSVNGAVIFSAVHKRAVPPVFIIHSENWVVYSFFNDKSRRTEIVSLDLYEGKTLRNSSEFSSVTAAPLEPFIERQAYIFPHNIMAMRETITEKGITSKHVLVGVSSGSVLEVPWALLDPHRSPDGREEGVIPYTPDLSLPHEAVLTYNHTLPHISGILTSPSGLESTSLVLIYGLDLFYTRVAPSKTFDVLKDDFEYWLITLVLGGLISAAYISKRLASRKALRQAWK